jgi:hypothetical protein
MWMKVDDGLHAHRKTRAVTKSHPAKSRDAAPMGLWVLAGSWAAQNRTDGWVPEDELDRFDQDWHLLVPRLISAGYWWPLQRDGERGYGFNDWHDYNDPTDVASKRGTFGNHVRWHVNESKVDPECQHCPTEPDEPEDFPVIAGRSLGESPPESSTASGGIALPVPEPDPNPTRTRPTTSSDESDQSDRFDEFWDVYAKKVGRKKAQQKWRLALRRPGVTADLLIAAAGAYIAWQRQEGNHPQFTKDPATWLNGEHWNDERVTRSQPATNVQRHLALARELAEQQPIHFPQIGDGA